MRRLLALAALAAAPAAAQQQVVAGWQISPIDGGCAMLRPLDTDGGPAVMVQLSSKNQSRVVFILPGAKLDPGYVYTSVVSWDGRIYPVHMPVAGEAAAPGLLLDAPDDRLVNAVTSTEKVAVTALNVTDAVAFPLTGAKEAAAEVRKCAVKK